MPKKTTGEKKARTKYNVWQVIFKMTQLAWKHRKSVLYICIALILVTAMQRIFELLVSPMILSTVETKAPLSKLMGTILLFTCGILVTSSVKQYLETIAEHGRLQLTMQMLNNAGKKYVGTSYANVITSDFEDRSRIAFNSVGFSSSYACTIWYDLVSLAWNTLGFIVFGFVLGRFNWLLMGAILILSAAGATIKIKLDYADEGNMKKIRKNFGQAWYLVDTMYDQEMGKDIRIFHMQQWIRDLYQSLLNTMREWYKKRETSWFCLDLIDVAVTFLRNGLGYFVLLTAISRKTITLSEFLLYTAAVGGFTSWVNGIIQGVHSIRRHSIDLGQYFEYLEIKEPFRFEGGLPLPSGAQGYEITLDHVTYRYPDSEKDAVSDISLTLHPYEKVAVVGLNGAGKTTLVNLILGLLDPTNGTLKLNGIDIREFNRKDYYTLFSAVFQSFDALQAPLYATIAPLDNEYDQEKMDKVLSFAGIKDKIDSLPGGLSTYYSSGQFDYEKKFFEDANMNVTKLSGGELQRVMLARALYKDGPILILDEPTAALDPIAENDMYQQYNAFTAQKTSVFISHRLASTRFCDRILFMDNGHIKEEGTHESLLQKHGAYADLFEVQSRYYQKETEEMSDEI
ncbi:MAG: ABC transporter ATP-binding protein [Firmicutes bacterium]|nr:ABC transporter ATP-binding protein [Bacillota bacterium]